MMPLQNRVTPTNEIVAISDRGLFMGNRGCLHNNQRQLVRHSDSSVRRWIICQLQFKDRRRELMSPGLYTELFFLDEVTALAAGHRPCAECRRAEFNLFKTAWLAGNPDCELTQKSSVTLLDRQLQRDRWHPEGRQRTFQSAIHDLPAGVMVTVEGSDSPWLWWGEQLHCWSFSGYTNAAALSVNEVTVLTPASTVNALSAGYVPVVHPSVQT